MRGPYFDQDNFEPGKGFTPDPMLASEDIVERDGYRDTGKIVSEFILAGERLAQFRREEFDSEYFDDEVEIPLTRSRNFDVADASMILEAEAKRLASLTIEVTQEPKKEPNKPVKEGPNEPIKEGE